MPAAPVVDGTPNRAAVARRAPRSRRTYGTALAMPLSTTPGTPERFGPLTVRDCPDQLTVAGVAAELPEHDPAQLVLVDVGNLGAHDARVVERPERGSVEEPGGAGLCVLVAREAAAEQSLCDLVVVDARLPGAGRGPGRRLIEAVVRRGDAGPAA